MIKVTQTTIRDLREDLFSHLQTLGVRYYDTHTNGEVMSRFTNDVDTLNEALNNSLTALFSSVITLTGILYLMLSKNPYSVRLQSIPFVSYWSNHRHIEAQPIYTPAYDQSNSMYHR